MSETQQVKTASKPRIGYCIPRMRGHAGWATVSEAGIRALSRYVEPVLFVEQIDEEAVRQKFPGVEYHVLPAVQAETWRDRPFRLLLRMAFSIWRARRLQNLNLNLVHSLEMFPTGWVGDALARKEQVRHVLTAHGTYTVFWMKRPMLEFFYRRILRRASAIFPVSHGTECRLWEFYGKDLGRAAVRTIWNGSDAGGRVPEDWVRNRPLPADPVVFSVGGIKERKGIHVSLRAFSLLQQKFPRARYRIAGVKTDTFYVRNLEEIIRREKIRNVEFLGVVSDEELDRLYRESSIFILLSQEDGMFFEGFGLVFLEAGAYGLPVIGTRSGGIPDVVIDGETGFLVPPADPEAAGRAMVRLAEDPALAARMGRAGRKRAEHLSWARYAEEQWGEYRKLLRARRNVSGSSHRERNGGGNEEPENAEGGDVRSSR